MDVSRPQPDEDVHDKQQVNDGIECHQVWHSQIVRVETQLDRNGNGLVDREDDDEKVPVQLLARLRLDERVRELDVGEFEFIPLLLLACLQVIVGVWL